MVSTSAADNKRKVDEELRRSGGSAAEEAESPGAGDAVEGTLWNCEIMLSTCCLMLGRRIEK